YPCPPTIALSYERRIVDAERHSILRHDCRVNLTPAAPPLSRRGPEPGTSEHRSTDSSSCHAPTQQHRPALPSPASPTAAATIHVPFGAASTFVRASRALSLPAIGCATGWPSTPAYCVLHKTWFLSCRSGRLLKPIRAHYPRLNA